jgi:hypothetical protein
MSKDNDYIITLEGYKNSDSSGKWRMLNRLKMFIKQQEKEVKVQSSIENIDQ